MDLNLEAAFDQPVDLSHQFDFPAGSLARPELVSLSPVTFTGRLERQGPGFLLNGRVVFDGVTSCARCLASVSFRRASDAFWVFAPAHEKAREGKSAPKADRTEKRAKGEGDAEDGLELAPEDLDVLYYDDLVVPFDPLVEEQVQLEVPLKALCREDCRGLCPMCGADRNLAPCACQPPSDERWKSLRTLLEPEN
jgi:uncharacterized protein